MSAVRLVRCARRLGISRVAVSAALWIEERTLRDWEERWHNDRLATKPLGRPARALTRAQREVALAYLHVTDGCVGVRSMMGVIEEPVSRAALLDIKRRFRYARSRRGGTLCAKLEWTRPGSVWALDWTDPESVIERLFTKILVVRDLASGQNLLTLPCVAESGEIAAREIEILIGRHGAPAVLKSDNGKSLRCGAVSLVLALHGILALPSPPRTPGYNGACEAGIGSFKVHVHHIAAASGRAAAWTCDDVLEAQRAVNTRVRENGLSAEDYWVTRRRFGAEERERLWALYRTHLRAERAARGLPDGVGIRAFEQDSLDRVALRRALEEVGLVRFRRRRIRPPIRLKKVAHKW